MEFSIWLKVNYGIDIERYELMPEKEKDDIKSEYDMSQNDPWKNANVQMNI